MSNNATPSSTPQTPDDNNPSFSLEEIKARIAEVLKGLNIDNYTIITPDSENVASPDPEFEAEYDSILNVLKRPVDESSNAEVLDRIIGETRVPPNHIRSVALKADIQPSQMVAEQFDYRDVMYYLACTRFDPMNPCSMSLAGMSAGAAFQAWWATKDPNVCIAALFLEGYRTYVGHMVEPNSEFLESKNRIEEMIWARLHVTPEHVKTARTHWETLVARTDDEGFHSHELNPIPLYEDKAINMAAETFLHLQKYRETNDMDSYEWLVQEASLFRENWLNAKYHKCSDVLGGNEELLHLVKERLKQILLNREN
jgi:hypothetical protein